MVYYNFKKHKEFFFIDFFAYFIPISMIIGNLFININSLICVFLFIFFIFENKKIYTAYKKYFIFFYILLIAIIINLIFSFNFKLSLVSSFGFIKYYLLFLSILFCLDRVPDFKKIFQKIIFFVTLFVIFDVLFQHFFLKDIFGNEIITGHGRRLSGPFGDEGIAGSFIGKFFFLSLIVAFEIKHLNKLIIPIIILSIITIILTNERSISIMFLLGVLILFLFYEFLPWKKVVLIITILLSLFALFTFNQNLKSHFLEVPAIHFKDNHHKAHFLTAYEIYKQNKIFGSGIKTFREVCNDKKYENIKTIYVKNRCATHPHNFYLEILSEVGILGISIIFLINLYILIFFINNLIKKNEFYKETLILFCAFFVLFWPLQTTGAFFSTWNGIFYWIFYALFFNLKSKLTLKSI